MKTKQIAIALFVVLGSLSMFTACGKKKSSSTTTDANAIAANSAYPYGYNGQLGNCAPVAPAAGSGMTFVSAGGTAYGQQAISLGATGIVGSGAIGGYSLGNYQYQRTTAQGDTIYLTVVGNAQQSNNGFVAQVSLSTQSIQQMLNSFGPTAAVCGIWFGQNNNAPLVLLTPGSPGLMVPTPGVASMGVYVSYQGGSRQYGNYGDAYMVLP